MSPFRPLALAIACGLLFLTSCGGGAQPSSSPASASAATSSSAARSSAAESKPAAPAGSAIPSGAATTHIVSSYEAVNATEIPLWVAAEAGIFKKNGLDVEVRYIASTTGIAALISGETQMDQGGGSEALNAATGGANLEIIGTLAPVYPFVFQVPSSITKPEQLRGTKIGVSTLGSASDIATRVSLRRLGLNPDKDVNIIAVGSLSNRVAALENGAIQGGLSQPPDTLTLEAKGFHTLFDLSDLKLPTANGAVMVTRSYASSHRDAVQKYIDSLVEGAARAKKDKPFTIGVLKKYLKSNDEHALDVTYDFYAGKVMAVLPYPKPEQLADAKAELVSKNPKAGDYDVNKLLDPSFVKSAADRGLDK